MTQQKDMTRKQFLSVVGAFFGLALLSRWPFGGPSRAAAKPESGSYGNQSYGGTTRQ